MPKNETIIESSAPAPEAAADGCSAYRTGLVLSALQKKLAGAKDDAERARIMAEIEALEEQLGF